MWRTVAVTLCAVAASAFAQPEKDLLLPQAGHVRGVVVNLDGKPVAGVRLDYSHALGQARETNSAGLFDVETRAPILVLRKAGFRSELIRTREATAPLRITLQRPTEKREFPTCLSSEMYVGIGGEIQFSPIAEISESAETRHVDYVARSYAVNTKEGAKTIRHGRGPMWGAGAPPDHIVWQSVYYEEIVYGSDGHRVIDARGKLPNGDGWRYLGILGESAEYSGVDEKTAKIFDNFLDRACLASSAF